MMVELAVLQIIADERVQAVAVRQAVYEFSMVVKCWGVTAGKEAVVTLSKLVGIVVIPGRLRDCMLCGGQWSLGAWALSLGAGVGAGAGTGALCTRAVPWALLRASQTLCNASSP